MESKPVEIALAHGEKLELLKRTLAEKTKRLEEVERKLRELKREDAEMAYLCTFIGPEYINPQGTSNAEQVAPLDQEREQIVYVCTLIENKLTELMQGGEQGAGAQPAAQPRQGGQRGMWGPAA